MARAHAAGAWVVLVAVACFIAIAIVTARLKAPARLLDGARRAVIALIGVQVALGAIAYAIGGRPEEPLHLLYGIAVLAALPLAQGFSREAPAAARAGTLAVAAAIMLALVGRSFGTG